MKLPENIESDYHDCVEALKESGFITRLEDCSNFVFVDVEGKQYPIPSQSEIESVIAVNYELVQAKMAQGFTKLELAPVIAGIPLLIENSLRC